MKHILKKTFRVWWPALLVTGFLCGCASPTQVPPRPTEEKPTQNKALVVIERPSTWLEGVTGIKVYDNRKFIGEIGPGGKLVWLRDPGLMNIQRSVISDPMLGSSAGLCLATEAGKSYRYKMNLGILDGPGTKILGGNSNLLIGENQSNEGSLVFFRFCSKDAKAGFGSGWLGYMTSLTLEIVNTNTKKLIVFDFSLYDNKSPWLALYLPLGEYNILSYKKGFDVAWWGCHSRPVTQNHRIGADFSVAKPNAGVYVGDIIFSDGRYSIGRDSDSAREFFRQGGIKLPYTEAIMEMSQPIQKKASQ